MDGEEGRVLSGGGEDRGGERAGFHIELGDVDALTPLIGVGAHIDPVSGGGRGGGESLESSDAQDDRSKKQRLGG